MKTPRPLWPVLLLIASTGIAAADLEQCRQIDDDIVRLFCYDRAAGRTPAVAAPAAAVPEASAEPTTAPATGRIGPVEVEAELEVELPGERAEPKSAPESGPAPRSGGAPPSRSEAATRPDPAKDSDARIEARIVGAFRGWSPGTRFTLDNGQVWEAVGASTHYSTSESPAVSIRRDFLGQHLMEIEGVGSRALVRRIEP